MAEIGSAVYCPENAKCFIIAKENMVSHGKTIPFSDLIKSTKI